MNAAEKSVQLLPVLVLQPKVYYCDQSDRLTNHLLYVHTLNT